MFRFFLGLEIGVLFLEALHPSGGIDKLLFAGEVGVAMGADINGEILLDGRGCLNLMPAGTGDGDIVGFGMQRLFHDGRTPIIGWAASTS